MFVEILIIEINIRSPAGEGLDIELISWCALINSLVRVLREVNLKARIKGKTKSPATGLEGDLVNFCWRGRGTICLIWMIIFRDIFPFLVTLLLGTLGCRESKSQQRSLVFHQGVL
jgi:hypothetical protein